MYKNILFDFDGTIFDTSIGIVNATKYTLDKFGINYSDINLNSFIGPPLQDSFRDFCGLKDDDVLHAIKEFRIYYKEKGLYESVLYNGIENVIKTLVNKDYDLFIASSKPTLFIENLLRKNNLIDYFKYISGSPIDGKGYSKEKVISDVIKKYNLKKDETIMIGDTKFDIIGAKQNQVNSIGVLYGLGTYEELYQQKPEFIAKNSFDILNIILD